ncbi:MAG TPA: MlaD family protein [Planctomycetota bacterium]|nr:MlaD family protein [Planctomycetota bacterium]
MRGIWLGFVFFVSLVLLGFGTLLVGDLKDVFGSKIFLQIHFERIQGLREGDDVRVEGLLFGKVKKIDLSPTAGVQVTVRLNASIVLYDDSEIVVESSSVLGGNTVSIKRGTRPPTKDLNLPLSGKSQPGLDSVGKMVDENRENLKALIANLKDMTQALKDGQGTVGKLLKTDELHKEAVDTIKQARETIAETKGEIKKLGENLNKIVDKVDKGEGPIAHLLNDKKMAQNLEKTIENVEKTSDNLKKITDKVQGGEGTLGKLVSDKEMGEKLKRTVENIEASSESIKKVTGKLESGEGSIGKLLQDDELYEKAKQTLDDLDKVFAKAARSVVELVAESDYFGGSEMQVTKVGIRITPSEDKFIQVSGAFMSLNTEGDIRFRKQVEEGENDSIVKADILLGYRVPWFLDRRLTVRGGLLEGKPGAGIDFVWDDWGFFSHPVRFTIEGRDAYNSLKKERIDEEISGPMVRAYLKTPLWTRRDTWFELLLSSVKLYAGVSRLGDREELMAGIGLEWPDDDLRMLVGFIGLAR